MVSVAISIATLVGVGRKGRLSSLMFPIISGIVGIFPVDCFEAFSPLYICSEILFD